MQGRIKSLLLETERAPLARGQLRQSLFTDAVFFSALVLAPPHERRRINLLQKLRVLTFEEGQNIAKGALNVESAGRRIAVAARLGTTVRTTRSTRHESLTSWRVRAPSWLELTTPQDLCPL